MNVKNCNKIEKQSKNKLMNYYKHMYSNSRYNKDRYKPEKIKILPPSERIKQVEKAMKSIPKFQAITKNNNFGKPNYYIMNKPYKL